MSNFKAGDRVRIKGWPPLSAAEIARGDFDINGATGTVRGRTRSDAHDWGGYYVVELDDKSAGWWVKSPPPCLSGELDLLDE